MFCLKCAGSGKFRSNGMMLIDCPDCNGTGDCEETEPEYIAIDKSSRAYKDAIKEIMELNPGISRANAAKMFEDTYDNV